MDSNDFDRIAEQTLKQILQAVDEVDELEAELSQGVLTLSFSTGTPYIINSHRAAGQIWMAAERTAWHFTPSPEGLQWLSDKPPHEELWQVLAQALSSKLQRSVTLRPS
jgi:CyaY protein